MSPSPAKSDRFARWLYVTALLLAAAPPVAAQVDAPVYFDGASASKARRTASPTRT